MGERFDDQLVLVGARFVLRPLEAGDRAGLTRAASDPAIWEQHPANGRWRPEVFAPYFDFLLASGGTLAIEDADGIVGCSRYYPVPHAPDDIGIGFTFLTRAHWGGAANREVKTLMLDHAFGHFERVWFHIAPDNIRSQKGTGKLGAVLEGRRFLDLAGTGGVETLCYVLPRTEWTG